MVKERKKTRTKVTPQLRDEVIKMRQTGVHYSDIAARFDIAKSTVERILKGPHTSDLARTSNLSKNIDKIVTDEVALIDQRIAEWAERRRQAIAKGHKRTALMGFITKYALTRTDVKWAHDKMPYVRITKTTREARLKKEKGTG